MLTGHHARWLASFAKYADPEQLADRLADISPNLAVRVHHWARDVARWTAFWAIAAEHADLDARDKAIIEGHPCVHEPDPRRWDVT